MRDCHCFFWIVLPPVHKMIRQSNCQYQCDQCRHKFINHAEYQNRPPFQIVQQEKYNCAHDGGKQKNTTEKERIRTPDFSVWYSCKTDKGSRKTQRFLLSFPNLNFLTESQIEKSSPPRTTTANGICNRESNHSKPNQSKKPVIYAKMTNFMFYVLCVQPFMLSLKLCSNSERSSQPWLNEFQLFVPEISRHPRKSPKKWSGVVSQTAL